MGRYFSLIKRSPSLNLERLEDRTTPAQFGIPWADSQHLTLSFAPDGTSALGISSNLVSSLTQQVGAGTWQRSILRAVQAWSQVANINIGVVPDGGQAFNSSGPSQRDPRFGDLRVGGLPMSSDALGEAVPPDTNLSGTLGGDIFFNTAAAFTSDKLYGVALHEVGHALGLAPSTDPTSVMYNSFNQNYTLSSSDIASIRGIYGSRAPDVNEGDKGNATFGLATRMKYPTPSGTYTGNLPVVSYGDITSRTDVDMFALEILPGYRGPVTFRVRTAGISLLAPSVSLFGPKGRLLATQTGIGHLGTNLVFTLPQVLPAAKYYLRITGNPASLFGVGRYSVAATFSQRLQTTATTLNQVMVGPYDALKPEELGALFTSPTTALFGDDSHQDDDPGLAGDMPEVPGYPAGTRFSVIASLSDDVDFDHFRVRTPESTTATSFVLTVSVRSFGTNGLVPLIEIEDDDGNELEGQVLVNGNGQFTIQVAGLLPKEKYFLHLEDDPLEDDDGQGNYVIDAAIGTFQAQVQTLSTTSLIPGQVRESTLYVARTQVFGMLLDVQADKDSSARILILNKAGQVVMDLSAVAGNTTSGTSPLLAPGEYRIRLETTGTGSEPISIAVLGNVLSDPIGPQKTSSILAPQYQSPTDPLSYLYPNGVEVLDPYLWLPWYPI